MSRKLAQTDVAVVGGGVAGLVAALVAADEADVVELEPGRSVRTDQGIVAVPATILATGGYSALWERTTNPPASVGDGIVLAYRAGAAVADLELVQFHPTVLASDGLLLSEALRGEGA